MERKAERPRQDVRLMGWGRERERRQTGRGKHSERDTPVRAHGRGEQRQTET